MERILLNQSNTSASINTPKALKVVVKKIEFIYPKNEPGNVDYSITLTGATSGSVTFHGSTIDSNIRFHSNESISISTANLSNNVDIIVTYGFVGDDSMHKQLDRSNVKSHIPWRFRTDA